MAGLVSIFALAPQAGAEPTSAGTAPQSDAPSTGAHTKAKMPAADVAPNYGLQKYRVGVRGVKGDFFPNGTSTAGTKLHVVETGADGKVDRTFDCITEKDDSNDVTDATFCPGERDRGVALRRRAASVNEPSPGIQDNSYYPDAGTTVTITQTTVNANLVRDTTTATLQPCQAELGPFCAATVPGREGPVFTSTDLVFEDQGIPPVARNDAATTRENTAVNINIKANDTDPINAPVQQVAITGKAKHGTATLVSTQGADPAPSASPTTSAPTSTSPVPLPTITIITLAPPANQTARKVAADRTLAAVTSYAARYTPKAGFSGTDTFTYSITTANGTATAKVTVKVLAAPASASASDSNGANDDNDGRNLADTGTQSGQLVIYGVALLAAGGGALAAGVKRRRGRHAR